MLEPTEFSIALIAGAMASLLYFGGLWLTVQRLAHAPNPFGLYIASFAIRMGALALGVFLVLQFGWQHCLVAMFGFLVVRYVMTLSLGLGISSTASLHARKQP